MSNAKSKPFTRNPRVGGQIQDVFWTIKKDFRPLVATERRNVVYPGKSRGLIESAPRNERGVKINKRGLTSVCDFILTEAGEAYYKEVIVPIVPKGYTSPQPSQSAHRNSGVATSDL